MLFKCLSALLLAGLVLVAAAAEGAAPAMINYQGYLTDLEGHPLEGEHSLGFAIYGDQNMSALPFWVELHSVEDGQGVTLADGLFNVLLGSLSPLPQVIFDEAELWLAVTVDGDLTEPLTRLTSVPFALRAAVADSLAGTGPGGGAWTISGDDALLSVPGNAGIGVTGPRRRLEVLGDGTGGGIRWGTSYGSSLLGDIYHAGYGNGFIINSHAGGGSWADLHLQTNAVTRLYVDSTGKVGVGTTTPAELLDVAGTVQMTGFKLPVGGGVGWVLTDDGTGTGTWQPPGGTTGDGDWIISGSDMYAANSGFVGVGTSAPAAALDVAGDGRVLRATAAGSRPAVEGKHTASGNYGYVGTATSAVYAASEGHPGIHAESDSVAVYGHNAGTLRTEGYLAGRYGAYGESATGNYGYMGGASFAIYGAETTSGNYGGIGYWNYGVLGHSDSNVGVNGRSVGGTGVNGQTTSGWAVYGRHLNSDNLGYIGGSNAAVYGESDSGNAIQGLSISGNAGYFHGDVEVASGHLKAPVIEITGGADFSEPFDVRDAAGGIAPQPGFLVSLDPANPGRLQVSSEAYDKKVAGVISGAGGVRPGLIMGQQGTAADGSRPVALTGRVYCWADAGFGSIEPGDLLTTCDTAGHAMKAADPGRAHGTVIGKAMTALESGRGLILVLVNLQ